MSVPQFAGRFAALISRFRRDKKANIAVIFAIAILPILSFVGAAVDYSLATRMRAKMQSAADAASVAAISKNSKGYNFAALMSGDGTVTDGVRPDGVRALVARDQRRGALARRSTGAVVARIRPMTRCTLGNRCLRA